MSFDKKNFSDIFGSMLADTRRRIPDLTDFEEGSVVRSLYESFSYELALLYEQLDLVYQAGFVDTAESAHLDRVVAVLGLKRNEPDFATGVVTFSRDKGLNEELIIPIGTLVTTEENKNQDPPKKAYLTSEEGRIAAGQTAVDVRLQAEARGKQMVADAETVTVMPLPVPGVKAITNKKPVRFLGRDRETDDELRQRAKQALLASGRASVTAIETALLGITGVRGVKVKEDFPKEGEHPENSRLGTIEVYVDGLNEQNAPRLRERLDQVRAAGVYVVLKPAIAIHLEAILQIEVDPRIAADERLQLEAEVATAVAALIDALGMGQPLLFTQLNNAVLKVNGVKDIPDFRLTTYREDDSDASRARGKVVLSRTVKLDNTIRVPVNTLVRTTLGQQFLLAADNQFEEQQQEIAVEVKAVRAGRDGELLRTGDATAWDKIKAGGINITVRNDKPILIERQQFVLADRRINVQILERLAPESIRVAAGQKPLRVRVQIKLAQPAEDRSKQRQAIESAVSAFFNGLQVGQSFIKTELEEKIKELAGGDIKLRLIAFPFQSQAPQDDYQIEASFVEKPEAEIIFVYSDRLELAGQMQLVLPLTANDEEKRVARGAVHQAIADYLDGLAPEEDADLEKIQAAAQVDKVLRIEFKPEDCKVLDAAGQEIKDRIKNRAVGVDLFEKLFLSKERFQINA